VQECGVDEGCFEARSYQCFTFLVLPSTINL
jgi:hypothetical protein